MNISKRTFLKTVGLAALGPAAGCLTTPRHNSVLVNDVHSQLNPTHIRCLNSVQTLDELKKAVQRARRETRSLSIAGGRHAGGGQQFGSGMELVDTRAMQRVLQFDPEGGVIEVEAGIQWPAFMAYLRSSHPRTWAIAQKQTGTDRLSIGGALSANAHGRGLSQPPFISNVESIELVDSEGNCHTCNRRENTELFKLVIGGYGLFGFVYSVKLRLVPLQKVRRVVRMTRSSELPGVFQQLIGRGFCHGDFQFAIDSKSDDFLNVGVLAAYEPVPDKTEIPSEQKRLSSEDWKKLIQLAHTSPTRAFQLYTEHYLRTTGQTYWSDEQYVSDYFEDYHREVDATLRSALPATEVIGELYVPRERLPHFLSAAREMLRKPDAPPVIYGTIRLVEKDTESFLAWAKESYACVIFNLHTPHTPEDIRRTADAFRGLIDLAIFYNGSYYLTYHRFATRTQILACYPQFQEFLQLKLKYDPDELFQNDWYRHYKRMFA